MTRYECEFRAGAAEILALEPADEPLLEEAALASLPAPVRRYVERSGAIGRPVVRNFRAVFTGDFRNGLQGAWMQFRSEQYNRIDDPARLFYMRCRMFGLPVEGLHVCRSGAATMRIRIARFFTVADGRGPELDRSESVTLLNDICVLAPGALPALPNLQWEEQGPLAALARFRHGAHAVTARLSFQPDGDLVNFYSEDRSLSSDGRTFRPLPWSTPLRDYAMFGGHRLASYGEAVWQMPEGPFSYGRFHLQEIEYNQPRPA